MSALLWVLTLSTAAVARQGAPPSPAGPGGYLYEGTGNVSLAGLFGRFGGKCSGEVERGLEEVVSAIWTVEALNAYLYLPGVTIGLNLFDVCEISNDPTGLFKMAEELSDEEVVNIGLLTGGEISESPPDSNAVQIQHIITGGMLADITVQLLANLQWTNVTTLIVDSNVTLNSFREKALQEGISIQKSVLVNSSGSCERNLTTGKAPTVTVVIASFLDIVCLDGELHSKLILAPTDFVFDFTALDLPKDTIVCLPSMQDKGALRRQLKSIQRRRDFLPRKPPVKGPLFLGTAASIVTALRPLRTALQEMCPNASEECAPDFIRQIKTNKTGLLSHEISPDDVVETLKVLKIEPSSNDEMFLYIASVFNANATDDFAIFQVFNLQPRTFLPVLIMINDDALTTPDVTPPKDPAPSLLQDGLRPPPTDKPLDTTCDHCDAPRGNLSSNATEDTPQVSWRYLTWVSVSSSVGFVGVTCTLSIMLFMAVKVCKDDLVEGSPYFSLLLMASVVLTYLSSTTFHLEFLEGGFMCVYRKCVPPVAFAVLFSLLLSRSVLVAFSESAGGLSSHVNGYLQSVLCVFMIGVQVSITAQNCLFAGRYDLTCAGSHDKYNVILTLAYDFLLLILLACVSPFIVRSKRNCREGLLFSISAFFITIVWSAWISFYILLPNEHKDAAVAFGLNATASVLLLCVFIPQMYLMAAPFPRDPTLPSLASLDRHVLTPPHPHFKSNQTLNDCAFGSYRNCDLGCANPTFPTPRPNGTNHPPADNFGDSDVTTEAVHPN